MKILVVAAHPDDELLGCGGTIAKHLGAGDKVYVIVLADGVTSRKYKPGVSRGIEIKKFNNLITLRKNEFFRASKIIGLMKKNCFLLGFPDQRLDSIPLLNIVKEIERLSEAISPDVIYTHHWGDINKDHRICFEATITAFRPNRKIKNNIKMFSFEIPGNMNILPPKAVNRFNPDHFVDITDSISKKIEALKAYKSELIKFPKILQPKNILELSSYRSKNKGYRNAEAFETLKLNNSYD